MRVNNHQDIHGRHKEKEKYRILFCNIYKKKRKVNKTVISELLLHLQKEIFCNASLAYSLC